MKKPKWLLLLYFILTPIILSFVIQLLIPNLKEYYSGLEKPFNLPSYVFPIAWNILYVLMGIAAYLVYTEKGYNNSIKFYYIQLFFNVLWTLIFFGFHWMLVSVIWIITLLILVVITAYKFYKDKKVSGYLFIPYILWLLFATYLNIAIYILN